MCDDRMRQIEDALDALVRPALRQHGGDVRVVSFEGGLLKLQMLGPCSGCPSAAAENEQIFEQALKGRLSQLDRVVLVTGVSDELIAAARAILKKT